MIDLHLHLDGSLSPALVLELAREQKLDFPCKTEEEAASLLSVPADCRSLNDYLSCFDWPVKVLQNSEALEAASYDLGSRLAAQGLLYAEIRFAPQQHTTKGLTQKQAVKAVCRGLKRAEKESGVFRAQTILCCMRGGGDEENRETVRTAQHFLGDGVCAADLAGAEALYPTGDYRELFQYAAGLGVPFTIHAGEAAGAESIREAFSFGARRIGHGVRCTEDHELMDQLVERGIPLELCPTSNLQTKAVKKLEEFPLRAFLQKGIRATLNTDNMTVSGVTLAGEYRLVESLGLTEAEKETLLRNGVEAAFLPPEEKRRLSVEIGKRVWPV